MLARSDSLDPERSSAFRPTVKIDTPNVFDLSVVETCPERPENYTALPYGTPHPDNAKTGKDLRLVWQGPVKAANNQVVVKRVYTTTGGDEDWFNFTLKYSADSNAYPIYVRTYKVLRAGYVPLPKGQPLTSLIGGVMTNAGASYETAPAVTFTGGGGAGAAATAILDLVSKTVVGLEWTSLGTGYTTAPTIHFAGGGGHSAAATALIQPPGAVLVAEETARLDQEDPEVASLYIKVHRVYETLPGPWIPFTRYDNDLGPVQGRKRAILNTGTLAASLTSSTKTTYEGREDSTIVVFEVEETWTTGEGTGANPLFPLKVWHTYDNERGDIENRSRLIVADGTEEATFEVVDGVATLTHYEPYAENGLLVRRIIEKWTIPAIGLPDKTNNEDGTVTTSTRTMVLRSSITEGDDVSSGVWTKISSKAVNLLVSWKIVETRPIPGNGIKSTKLDEDGEEITVVKTLRVSANIVTDESVGSGVWTRVTKEPLTDKVAWEVVQTRSLPGVAITSGKPDEDGVELTTVKTLRLLANIDEGESIDAGIWTRVSSDPITALVGWQVELSRTLPGIAIPKEKTDEDGETITETRQLVDRSTVAADEDVTDGVWTRIAVEPVTAKVAWLVTTTRPLPGLPIVTTKPDEDGDLTTTKTLKLLSAIEEGEDLDSGIWTRTESEAVTALVGWEVKLSRAVPGRPRASTTLDKDGGPVLETRVLSAAASITPAESFASGTWTRITSEAVSELVAHKVTTTKAAPGTPIPETTTDEDGVVKTTTRTFMALSAITAGESVASGVWTKISSDPVTATMGWKVVATRALPGTAIDSTRRDDDGVTVTISKVLKLASTITSTEGVSAGIWTKVTKEPVTALVAWQVTETRAIPGNARTSTSIDEHGNITTETRTMVEASTITTETSISSGIWTRTFEQPITAMVAWKIVQVRPVPHTQPSFEVSIPDLVPPEMRGVAPTETLETLETGTASLPTLATGDISRKEAQIDQQTYRLTIVTRSGLTLPVVQVGTETNKEKQVVTVTRTMDVLGTSTEVPSALQDVRIIDLGNGLELAEVTSIPSIFVGPEYSVSVRDPVPAEFAIAAPLTRTETTVSGAAVAPTLATGDVLRIEKQLDEFLKRLTVESRGTLSLPIVLHGKATNDAKQVVSITKTLRVAGSDPSPSETREVQIEDLGNGTVIETLRDVSSVFPAGRYEKTINDLVPREFQGAIPVFTKTERSSGIADTDPDLLVGELSRVERQIDAFVKEITTTGRGTLQLPVVMQSHETTTEYGGGDMVTEATIDDSLMTIDTGYDIVDSSVKDIGGGLYLKVTKSVYDAAAGGGNAVTSVVVDFGGAGYSSFFPPGTVNGARVVLKGGGGHGATAVPVVTAGVITAINVTNGGSGYTSAPTVIIYRGYYVGSGVGYMPATAHAVIGAGSGVGWPELHDYDVDEETGQTIHTTYRVVDAATAATATISAGVVTRYKHIDKWRSMKIVTTYSTPASYEEQRFGAHNFPTLWDGAYAYSDGCGAFVSGLRGGFSALVQMRVVVSFSATKQTFTGLALIPKTLILGKSVQLPSDMLMNSGSFTYTGSCTGSISYGASSPSYATYVGTVIGTEQLITGESVKMKNGGGLYRNTAVYVTML